MRICGPQGSGWTLIQREIKTSGTARSEAIRKVQRVALSTRKKLQQIVRKLLFHRCE